MIWRRRVRRDDRLRVATRDDDERQVVALLPCVERRELGAEWKRGVALGDVVDGDERRAAMVSNMMVVLCSDQATQPIVNTGTLYS